MQKIIYPLSFNLRVIVKNNQSKENYQRFLENLLLKLNILFTNIEFEEKAKGKYLRFIIRVTLNSSDDMHFLYKELGKAPEVITAL